MPRDGVVASPHLKYQVKHMPRVAGVYRLYSHFKKRNCYHSGANNNQPKTAGELLNVDHMAATWAASACVCVFNSFCACCMWRRSTACGSSGDESPCQRHTSPTHHC